MALIASPRMTRSAIICPVTTSRVVATTRSTAHVIIRPEALASRQISVSRPVPVTWSAAIFERGPEAHGPLVPHDAQDCAQDNHDPDREQQGHDAEREQCLRPRA